MPRQRRRACAGRSLGGCRTTAASWCCSSAEHTSCRHHEQRRRRTIRWSGSAVWPWLVRRGPRARRSGLQPWRLRRRVVETGGGRQRSRANPLGTRYCCHWPRSCRWRVGQCSEPLRSWPLRLHSHWQTLCRCQTPPRAGTTRLSARHTHGWLRITAVRRERLRRSR